MHKAAHGVAAVGLRCVGTVYAAFRSGARVRFGLVLGGRGAVSPPGTNSAASSW